MPRKPKPCPCVEHRNELVPYSSWQRHVQLIAQGKLDRWTIEEGQTTSEAEVDETEEEKAGPGVVQRQEDADALHGDLSDEEDIRFAFANDIAELVARNRINVTGAEAMLKATERHYGQVLPETHSIPGTWHQCKKTAYGNRLPMYFTRDFCPECDQLFPLDVSAHVCPECSTSTRYRKNKKARRQAYYYPIEDKVKRLFASKYTAKQVGYGTSRSPPEGPMNSREVIDTWDGSILESLFHDLDDADKGKYLYLAQSNDGVEVEKNTTYTPITAKLLNLPPSLRGQSQHARTFHTRAHTV